LLTTGPIDPNNRAIWAGVDAAARAATSTRDRGWAANVRVIWNGVDAAAREAGVNLICYPGRLVQSPIGFEAQRNVIYRMVDSDTVDGLIVMGGLNAWLTTKETCAFLQKFRPRPVVTTGIVLDGFPGVTVDNYHGMYEVIAHLATAHQRRRIAFIRGQAGHQEADDRYQAYLDVLSRHNLPFDPEIVYQGDFKESGGIEGAHELLRRQVHFDALVAASDNMAIGAMKTLQARGVRVPADVAIAGLNGEEEGLVVNPPLTTAPLHFFEQAYQATLMVLAMLEGQEVPSKVVLPTRMVVRQSCGCPDPLVTHAEAVPHLEKLDSFTDEIRQLDSLVFGEADSQLQIQADEPVRRLFPVLLKSFVDESRGKPEGDFLRRFIDTVQKTTHTNDDFPRWHEIISILRRFAISQLTDTDSRLRIENLVQQARVVLGESARRHYAYRVLQADEKLHSLGEISQRLNVVTNLAELTNVLEHSLALLGIPRCYLFIYEDPLNPDGLARFIFSYENQVRVFFDPRGELFLARKLLPDRLLAPDRHCRSLVVEPLFFRDDQLGYAVFEADPQQEALYEILGGQISAALKRTLLTERNIRLFEEAVEARKAAEQADLLKSRFLSMVSHELRTPLALIVGTIEMMLQEESTGSSPPLPTSYRKDMDGIHASSKHLFRLIGDVLDLASNQAGELRLVAEPLDLSTLFTETAALGEAMAREKGLEWSAKVPLRLPLVLGDRTRLRQITLNLLANAVKFTEHGSVSMLVTVADGNSSGDRTNVLVKISDTGMGIPPDEQALIFDEFRRSERSVARGYGGMGLGLAITKRLVELHGGKIGVKSLGVEETGSTFYFTLPVMPNLPASSETSANRRNTVLLLGESESEQLRQHLQRKGFEVEALDVLQHTDWLTHVIARPPGAVVLDFQPATERGWELMQLLKQNPETSDVPVVFYNLSAGSMLELDYLSKPVASAELFLALERLGVQCENSRQPILVVDDDPGVLEMHVRMLESKISCRILKARHGKQALELMQTEHPVLVLLDLMMPEMDGFEVLRVMREQETTRNIPVIVLSAQILTAHDMSRLQEGVAAVLGKGLFSVDEVLAQVESALGHSKRLGSQASRTVRQAMAYIHEHFDESISRADLARHVAITERYLTHCFREEMGITPMIYLNRYRIKRAKALLEQGNMSITEVALAAGFSDASYFNRVFRQEVGTSPGAYQRGHFVQ